jgi:hypothetical protein
MAMHVDEQTSELTANFLIQSLMIYTEPQPPGTGTGCHQS